MDCRVVINMTMNSEASKRTCCQIPLPLILSLNAEIILLHCISVAMPKNINSVLYSETVYYMVFPDQTFTWVRMRINEGPWI